MPTPTFTGTFTPTNTITPTPTIDQACNRATFVADVTIPDNTIFQPSEPFTKTWRIKNIGTCSWTTDYKLAFLSGDKMNGPDSVAIPINVAPDQTVDISVNLTAPNAPGKYQGFWQLQRPDGEAFLLSASVKDHIWVKIDVAAQLLGTPTLTPVVPSATNPVLSPIAQATAPLNIPYDFVQNACAAQWESTDGPLPCPGQDGDIHGFVVISNQASLEDGTTASLPTLLTFPSSSSNGFIQGTFPDVQIQAGDHLQATVSCENGATACSVLFSIQYLDSSGAPHNLWTLGEFYDGKYYNLDLDLSQFAGQKVDFVLGVSSIGSSIGDRALWVAPRIVHFPVTAPAPVDTSTPVLVVPSSTPTATSTLAPTPTLPATLTPTPVAGNQGPLPSIQQIVNNIISFFKQLLGGK